MNIIVIVWIFWSVGASSRILRDTDICGSRNGRRIYLELGERGVLTAANISFNGQFSLENPFKSNSSSRYAQCSLELVTCPACIITVSFSHLSLPSSCGSVFASTPCPCDRLWLSEPPYGMATGHAVCGSRNNSDHRSLTRTLLIMFQFVEDHKHAFTLEYTAERNRQFIHGMPGVLPGPFIDVASHKSMNSNGSSSGVLSSPYFPATYPRDLGAEHVLSCGTEQCRVRLLFTDYLLSSSSIMEFYDWNGQRLEVVSGASFRPPVIVSTGPSLLIRFYANGGTGPGYKAEYNFLTASGSQDPHVRPITDCGGTVETLGGAITMMNMVGSDPRESPRPYDCVWLVRPPASYLHLKTHLYLRIAALSDMAGPSELAVRSGIMSNKPLLETIRWPSLTSRAALPIPRGQAIQPVGHVIPVSTGFYVSLRGTFGRDSKVAIVYAAFSYLDCYSGSEFLCQNHRCIQLQLHCDGFDHCGDNSDEPNSCYNEWEKEPVDRRWYSHTPNYFFPKIERYPDLKTATMVFVISSIGLILLISALIVLLYRMGSRARQQRELQSRLQTISDLLDGVREEPAIDDPPCYEAPPDYDQVIKVGLQDSSEQFKRKKEQMSELIRCHSAPPRSFVPAAMLEVILPPISNQNDNFIPREDSNMLLDVPSTSRSVQTTPIPESPPPSYDAASLSGRYIRGYGKGLLDASEALGLSLSLSPIKNINNEHLAIWGESSQSWLMFRYDNNDSQNQQRNSNDLQDNNSPSQSLSSGTSNATTTDTSVSTKTDDTTCDSVPPLMDLNEVILPPSNTFNLCEDRYGASSFCGCRGICSCQTNAMQITCCDCQGACACFTLTSKIVPSYQRLLYVHNIDLPYRESSRNLKRRRSYTRSSSADLLLVSTSASNGFFQRPFYHSNHDIRNMKIIDKSKDEIGSVLIIKS